MSWSNSWVGRPSRVAAQIDKYGETLTGNSKEEFDGAKDGLKSLVLLNSDEGAIHLDANGHAYQNGDAPKVSTVNVTLKKLGTIVE